MNETNDLQVSFSHVQLFVDHLEHLSAYQDFQDKLNTFYKSQQCATLEHKKQEWETISLGLSPPLFVSHGRDIVRQFLAGLGFRITKAGPQRLLVTSSDPSGVQFIIAARTMEAHSSSSGTLFAQGESVKKKECERIHFFLTILV